MLPKEKNVKEEGQEDLNDLEQVLTVRWNYCGRKIWRSSRRAYHWAICDGDSRGSHDGAAT